MLPVSLRIIAYTQKDTAGVEPGVFLVRGKAALHLSWAPKSRTGTLISRHFRLVLALSSQ